MSDCGLVRGQYKPQPDLSFCQGRLWKKLRLWNSLKVTLRSLEVVAVSMATHAFNAKNTIYTISP